MADLFRNIYLSILLILGIYSVFTLFKNTFYIKLYAIVTLGVEIIGFFYLRLYHTPIAWFYNLYSFFEIWAWTNFFISILNINRTFKFWVFFVGYTTLFMSIGNLSILKFNNDGVLLNNVIVTFFVFYYFYFIFKMNLNISGNFWIMVGALFYHVGGFLLTGMIQIVAKKDTLFGSKLFVINYELNICFYSLVLFGLIKLDKEFDNSLSNS